MTASRTIALDAMGGDHAPTMVLGGADRVLLRFPQTKFLLYGDEARLKPMLDRHPELRQRCEVRHSEGVVASDEKPSIALRKGRNSSMRHSINAVKAGEAAAVVSAGNTGALMAMSKFVLGTLPGIDRPALASFLPTARSEVVVLDLGANVECDARNLVEFAVMGANYAHAALGRYRPKVALLNIGVEEVKGHDVVKEAADILRSVDSPAFEYCGFAEGNDISKGDFDVIVTDGFTGNVALKTVEGTAKLMGGLMSTSFRRSTLSKIGYLFARNALMALKERMDPRFYNGAVFLGLNGIAVKSHGGTDDVGFASAIAVAVDLVNDHLVERIQAAFQPFMGALASSSAARAPETQSSNAPEDGADATPVGESA